MGTDDGRSREAGVNTFSGSGGSVVQARDISGDVHLHSPRREPMPVPRQLPVPAAHFVNRIDELTQLDTMLAGKAANDERPVGVSTIGGTAGAGKTALVLHWAHRVRDQFPDGDLYVDLRGYDGGASVPPGRALERFLQALNVPSDSIPVDMDAQAALYRSVLTDRRVLVVLDNAASPEQVRPLLPASPGCLALVTSRSRMPGLVAREGARPMSLELLTESESLALLAEMVGRARVDDEPEAARHLVRRCCHLPLAIRIAAERALYAPDTPLEALVSELSRERDRLDVLSSVDDDETSIRAVFSWSYETLPPEVARMFRLLSLHPGADLSLPAAASLAGTTLAEARRQVEKLVNTHLLEQVSRERYRFHDLLHSYASECTKTYEANKDLDSAHGRLFTWYLRSARSAVRIFYGEFPGFNIDDEENFVEITPEEFSGSADALKWLDAEQENIAAVTICAEETRWKSVTWKIPAICRPYLRMRRLWDSWLEMQSHGLAAAENSGNDLGIALTLNGIGVAHVTRHEYGQALSVFRRSLKHWKQCGEQSGYALALGNLGDVNLYLGNPEIGISLAKQSREIYTQLGDKWGEAQAELTIGLIFRYTRSLQDSLTHHERFQQLNSEIEDHLGQSLGLVELATTHQLLGNYLTAINFLRQAIHIDHDLGNHWDVATTCDQLGRLLREHGNTEEARKILLRALRIFESQDTDRAASVREELETLAASEMTGDDSYVSDSRNEEE